MQNDEPVNVLLVDDQPGKLLSYEAMLGDLGENLVSASSAREALAYLLKADVAVILIDVCMPELDGFELAKMIREHPRFQKTAIIFISAIHMSESDFLRGYEAGAVDYLSVPIVPQLLRAKVRVFSELYRKTRQLQRLNEELESRVAERTEALMSSTDRLMVSEQGRSLALAAGHMGSWALDLTTDEWFWDEGQSRIFGVEHGAFVPSKEKMKRAIYPDDLPSFERAVGGLSVGNNSFEIEIRIVRPNAELRWCHVVAAATFDHEAKLIRLSGVTTDITERKETDSKQALLAREVDHRAKNALAIVQAIMRLARRDDITTFVNAVEGRIKALAQAHELLSQSRWKGAEMLRLVLEELAPYQGEENKRVTAVGPSILVSPENAQTIAIALHELATNAAKYGALSNDGGRVDVSWHCFEDKLVIDWIESGGPVVVGPPSTVGFGTKILKASFSQARNGDVRFEWKPEGMCCTLQICTNYARKYQGPSEEFSPMLASKGRVLLVEDEILVGMFMRDLLGEKGFQVTEPCRTLADGLAAANREMFDAAVLDMNLGGESVYPLADMLLTQGVPFVFVTGYTSDVVAERFSATPVLQKPVEAGALVAALNLSVKRNTARYSADGNRRVNA